ncbi:hypothetical protein RvY_18532-4 [Ramazzottius varieornatus]|nr:hypothetical protein RvY_18532-4 [Ramazzottius varieornatus]
MTEVECSAAANGDLSTMITSSKVDANSSERTVKIRVMEDDTNMRLEDFAQSFATGQVVWAINKGWHKAKFIAMETDKYPGDHSFPVPVYKVHYLRFGKR